MTDTAIRELIVQALRAAHVPGARDTAAMAAFVATGADVPMDRLDLDSLSAMEVCIHIELHAGPSLAPDAVRELPGLGALAQLLAAAGRDGGAA